MAFSGKEFDQINRQTTSPLGKRELLVESSPYSRPLNRRSYHLGSQIAAGSDRNDVTLPRPSSRASSSLPTYRSYQSFEPFESREVRDLINRSGGCGMVPPRPKYRTAAEPNNHMVMAVGATDVTAHFVSRPTYSLREQRFLKHSALYCEFLALSQRPTQPSVSNPATPSVPERSSEVDESVDPPSPMDAPPPPTSSNPTIDLPKVHLSSLRETSRSSISSAASSPASPQVTSMDILHRSTGFHRDQERRLHRRLAQHQEELKGINHRSHPLQVYVHL